MNGGTFALQRSDLNPFLFAEVGAERNGMVLTVVSVIARSGEDPWSEAMRLSTLPKTAAIDYLAGAIARMPTSVWALADATTIAARLVSLLPSRARATCRNADGSGGGFAVPPWARTSLLYAAMGAWLAVTIIAFHGPPAADHHPTEQFKALHRPASDARLAATPSRPRGQPPNTYRSQAALGLDDAYQVAR